MTISLFVPIFNRQILTMKLNFDFTTFQSLGNVHDDTISDNFKSFEDAKALFKSDKSRIGKSIIDGFDNLNVEVVKGLRISIPVGHYSDEGFLESLEFEVASVDGDEVNLALTNVKHKTPKTK